MRIATRLRVTRWATLFVAAAVGLLLVRLNAHIRQLEGQVESSRTVVEEAFRLRALTLEFVLTPEQRIIDQWTTTSANAEKALRTLPTSDLESAALIDGVLDDHERADALFDRLMGLGAPGAAPPLPEGRVILAGQLVLKTESMADGALQLARIKRERIAATQQFANLAVILLVLGLVATVTATGRLLSRSINVPLQRLMEGTQRVGAGDLEHRIGLVSKDEMGELATAFDQMTENLKQAQERQREAEQRVEASEARYRNLFENMADGYALHEILLDEDGKPCDYRFLEVNPAFERILRLPREQVLGRTALECLPRLEPYWIERYGRVALTGEPIRFEEYALEFDRHFEVSASSPEHGLFAVVFRDVTERKRTEQALREASRYNRNLIETSLDPLVTIGPDGRITDVNMATENATGRPRNELVGSDFSDYFTDPAKARAGYERVFREGFVRDYPLEIRRADGHVTPVLYNATVYRDAAGEVAGLFAAARDITERKRAEEELRQAYTTLEQTLMELRATQQQVIQSEKLAALGTLAAGVAHELNNPLMGIFNYVAFVRERVEDPALKYPLERAERELKRIRDLLKNMLAFSRPSGEALGPVDLGAVLAHTVDLSAPDFRARQIEFIQEVPPDLPQVTGREGLLQQVILNLLLNARDAVESSREKRVTLRAFVTDKAVGMEVRDTGEGMSEAVQGRIFDPFFTTKAPGKGTGLGLTIVQSIVTELGGKIEVESSPGAGAIFTVLLPKASVIPQGAPAPPQEGGS